MIRRVLYGLLAAQLSWASAVAGQGNGVTLWSSVEAGMTMQEVQLALPGSALADDGTSLKGPDAQVAGQPMRTYISFRDGRATKVSLVGSGIASDVRTGLSAKYGTPVKPLSCSSISSSISICVETWSAPNSVKVTFTKLGTGIMVDYEVLDTTNL